MFLFTNHTKMDVVITVFNHCFAVSIATEVKAELVL